MVARQDHRSRLESLDAGQDGVKGFQGADLFVKEPRVPRAIGGLVVQEEEIVLAIVLFQCLHLLLNPMRTTKHLHTDEPRDTPVHWIGGYGGRVRPVEVVKSNKIRQA